MKSEKSLGGVGRTIELKGRLLIELGGAVHGEGILPLLSCEAAAGQTLKDTDALQDVRDVDFTSELFESLQKYSISSVCLRETFLDALRRTEHLKVDRKKPAAVKLDVFHYLGDSH